MCHTNGVVWHTYASHDRVDGVKIYRQFTRISHATSVLEAQLLPEVADSVGELKLP